MVMFSTTYSESAYPSNCGMYELKQTPGELVDCHGIHGTSPLQALHPVYLNRIIVGKATAYLFDLPLVALFYRLLDEHVVILRQYPLRN